jgi:hypothetical protein
MVTPTYASSAPAPVTIQIKDQCNPATFNAAIGPGTCVGNGIVTFQQFVNELMTNQRAPQWQFAPSQRLLRLGPSGTAPVTATNNGGELHSFTEVEKFGGGVIPLLNKLSNSGETVPQCSAAFAALNAGKPNSSFVFPGQSFTDIEDSSNLPQPVLYQCCIHPWMHEVITVEP